MRLFINSLIKDVASFTYHDIVRRKLATPFIVFVAFLVSFSIARLIAYFLPQVNLIIGQYHIHHFYYGITLMVISNWITLISNRKLPHFIAAALFGIGMGISADEFGLLLTCTSPLRNQCDYHARIGIDLFIIIVSGFLSFLYFIPISRQLLRLLYRQTVKLVRPKRGQDGQ